MPLKDAVSYLEERALLLRPALTPQGMSSPPRAWSFAPTMALHVAHVHALRLAVATLNGIRNSAHDRCCRHSSWHLFLPSL